MNRRAPNAMWWLIWLAIAVMIGTGIGLVWIMDISSRGGL